MQHCVNCGAWKDGDSMKLKFCGICREQDVQYVRDIFVEYVGEGDDWKVSKYTRGPIEKAN